MDDNLKAIRRWSRQAFPLGEGSVGFETISVTVQALPGSSYELLLMARNRRMDKTGMVISTFTLNQWRADPANIVKQTWISLIARVLGDKLGIKLE